MSVENKTYTEVNCHDEAGEADGSVLSDDGQADHLVPGQSVHQPAQSVAEQQESQAADQTVDSDKLETLAKITFLRQTRPNVIRCERLKYHWLDILMTYYALQVYLLSSLRRNMAPTNCQVLSLQADRLLARYSSMNVEEEEEEEEEEVAVETAVETVALMLLRLRL